MSAAASSTLVPGRDSGIQALRGVAVVLMVAGHVIGSDGSVGLTVAADSGWRFFYRALEDVRMPLFTVLSGFVYGWRPIRSAEGLPGLARGKTRRLLVPYAVLTPAFFLVALLTPGVHDRPDPSELSSAYVYGYVHLWFLPAIFLIFLVVGLLDAMGALRCLRRWAGVTTATGVIFVLVHVPGPYDVVSVNDAIHLLPFFLLGYGAHRYAQHLLTTQVLVTSIAVFVPVYGIRLWTIIGGVEPSVVLDRAISLSVAASVLLTVLAVRQRLETRALVWMGQYSFGIYLLHVLGSAGARILASHVGVTATPALFVLCLSVAIALPIAFERCFGGVGWISWTVLGQAPSRPDVTTARTPVGGH